MGLTGFSNATLHSFPNYKNNASSEKTLLKKLKLFPKFWCSERSGKADPLHVELSINTKA